MPGNIYKTSTPFFSVVMPLYNKQTHISEAIKSVLDQTFSDFELIIVNDGSTDDSVKIVESTFDDQRIRLIHKKNGGVSSARNKGIEVARGSYIAFLDADDVWMSNHLSDIVSMIGRKEEIARLYCTGYNFLHSDGTIYGINPIGDEVLIISPEQFFSTGGRYPGNTSYSLVWSSAVCIPVDILVEVGGFDTRLKIGEDQDLWRRIAMRFAISFCSRQSALYRLDSENNSYSERNLKDYYRKHYDNYAILASHYNLADIWSSFVRYVKCRVKMLVGYRPRQF